MRFYEFKPLFEGRGLFGRSPGDIYVDRDGTEYSFDEIASYPSSGQFESVEERDDAVHNLEQSLPEPIMWVNKPNSSMLAFSIASFTDVDDGNVMYWGKYFKEIKGDMTSAWQHSSLPAGFKFGGAGAVKMQANMKPQDLIKSDRKFSSLKAVINTVTENADEEHKEIFGEALSSLAMGSHDITFPGMGDQMPALRDYFNEIMQPIALMGGVVGGDAEQARNELAGGAEWRECSVYWPMAGNEPLVDSILTAPNGQKIGVSSKGGKGADASIKNIFDAYIKAKDEGNRKLLRSAKFTIDIIKIVQANTGVQGPIEVAKFLGIRGLNDKVQSEIEEYIASGKEDLDGVSKAGLKLIGIANPREGFKTGYAMLTGAAKLVAAKINSNQDFSKGAMALMNQASMIQVYTTLKKVGNDVKLDNFKAVYPPEFDGHLIVNGTKNYMATTNKGKLAFGFGTAHHLAKAAQVPKPVDLSAVTPTKKKGGVKASKGGRSSAPKGTTRRSKR